MQRKDLALRVLSTAAIMSIVTSIAAPAFADVYYIGKGSIDVEATTDADGKQYVKVTQGGILRQPLPPPPPRRSWKQPGLRTLPGRASLTRTQPLP